MADIQPLDGPVPSCRHGRGGAVGRIRAFLHTIWMLPKIVVPPKSSILIGFPLQLIHFWGTPIFGNAHIHYDPDNQSRPVEYLYKVTLCRFKCCTFGTVEYCLNLPRYLFHDNSVPEGVQFILSIPAFVLIHAFLSKDIPPHCLEKTQGKHCVLHMVLFSVGKKG